MSIAVVLFREHANTSSTTGTTTVLLVTLILAHEALHGQFQSLYHIAELIILALELVNVFALFLLGIVEMETGLGELRLGHFSLLLFR